MDDERSDVGFGVALFGFFALLIGGMFVYNHLHPTVAHEMTGVILDTEIVTAPGIVINVPVPVTTYYVLVDIDEDRKPDRRVEVSEEEFSKAVPGKTLAFTIYED